MMLAALAFLAPLALAGSTSSDASQVTVPVKAIVDGTVTAGVTDTLPSVKVGPQLSPSLVSIGVQVDAGGAASANTAPQADAAADARPASLAERVVDAAAPAAAPVAAVTLVGLLVFCGTAVQAWLGRAGSLLTRGGRALAGLIGIPLFSRIERSRLMDNPARAHIHEAITQEPGLSLTELAQRTGVAWGTAVHHLRRLESHGLLVSKRQGERRYFIANTPAAAQRSAVSVVMHPTARRIARLLHQQPGIDQTGICLALQLNNPAASKHLGQFEAQGLVVSRRAGRSRVYQPTGALHEALLVVEPALGHAAASPSLFGSLPVAA